MDEYMLQMEDALVEVLINPPGFLNLDYDEHDDSGDDDSESYEDDEDDDEDDEDEDDDSEVSSQSRSDEDDGTLEVPVREAGSTVYGSEPSDMSSSLGREQANFEAGRQRLSISNITSPTTSRPHPTLAGEDDNALVSLAEGNFSSPSQYPLFTQPTRREVFRDPTLHDLGFAGQVSTPTRTHMPPVISPEISSNLLTRRLDDQRLPGLDTMSPPAGRAVRDHDVAPGSKRQRTSNSTAGPSTYQPAVKLDSDDDSLFGSSPQRAPKHASAKEPEPIDLTNATEVPEPIEPPKPEPDNRTKLRAFQCVICMDDVTNLTVTHCGHLFCRECLHASLHTGTTRGRCPMCRQKVTSSGRGSKSFWPLELKLQFRTRKGKRKADDAT